MDFIIQHEDIVFSHTRFISKIQDHGYEQITEIKRTKNHIFFSGVHTDELQKVLLHYIYIPGVLQSDINRIKNICTLLKSSDPIHVSGLVEYILLKEASGEILVLIYDLASGIRLNEYLAKNHIGLSEKLDIAFQLASAVNDAHGSGINHMGLRPAGILFSEESGRLLIQNLGTHVFLPLQKHDIYDPETIENTLPYISPEETGRMGRIIDLSSDLYSLGAVLYELLTGEPPFKADDPMELIHAHIARVPISPYDKKKMIPKIISDITMKLLKKNPEDRFQSAYGICSDLETCLKQLQAYGEISLDMPAKKDVHEGLSIPKKIYGRENELEILISRFNSMLSGKSECALVAGYSGIGKTSLCREICNIAKTKNGLYISGKFDQYHRNIPYSAIIHAFQEMVEVILGQGPERINKWREALINSLGVNAQVIMDVIPEIELITGRPQPVVRMSILEEQNRFNLVFINFIKVFAQKDHPLVLFLDDLQWADSASLELISNLLLSTGLQYLFLLGAYRDNEVDYKHPLMDMIRTLTLEGIPLCKITLNPIDEHHIKRFVADTLQNPEGKADPLAHIIFERTRGNPFFIYQSIQSLYAQGLIAYDYEKGAWTWDTHKIKAEFISENVIDLITEKINRLSGHAQETLKTASCIGSRLDPEMLCKISRRDISEITSGLYEAEKQGLVIFSDEALSDPGTSAHTPVDNDNPTDQIMDIKVEFIHDRVRQAVYSEIKQVDKMKHHLTIGQYLQQTGTDEETEERIFDITNHLNMGIDLLTSRKDRDDLAALNLLAGMKAKSSAAFAPALNYLQTGLTLLEKHCWESEYELALNLHQEAAEASYLCGDFSLMDHLSSTVMSHTKDLLDRAKIYEIRISSLMAENKPMEAVDIALDSLNMLGVNMPKKPGKKRILVELIKIKMLLAGKQKADIIDLPKMTNPTTLAAMRILVKISSAAFISTPVLYPLIVFKQVELSLKKGNAPESVFGYAVYGLILCGLPGRLCDIEDGYKFGRLALDLIERFNIREHKSYTLFIFNCFVRHWKDHYRDTLPRFIQGYRIGLETGNLEGAVLCLLMHDNYSYGSGINLVKIEKEMDKNNRTIRELKQKTILHLHEIPWQTVQNLIGKGNDACRLKGPVYDEDTMLSVHIQAKDRTAIGNMYYNKGFLSYLFRDFEQAFDNFTLFEPYADAMTSTMAISLFAFYDSLTCLALYRNAPATRRKRLMKRVSAEKKRLERWAHHAPMNNNNKLYLVEAERFACIGNDLMATEYYNRSIEAAERYAFYQEKALANELAARFNLARGNKEIAGKYLCDAHSGFEQWGASTKTKQLEEEFPGQLNLLPIHASEISIGQVDYSTIVESLQAISTEIVLESLIKRLLTIVMENAGANRVIFISVRDDALYIDAEYVSDREDKTLMYPEPIANRDDLLVNAVYFVKSSGRHVVLDNAAKQGPFINDAYVELKSPKSVLCIPVIRKGVLIAILYLENTITSHVFTPERIRVLELLASQAAISIENAKLYESLISNERILIDLSHKREELETIINFSPAVVFLVRADKRLSIEFVSDNVRRFGYTPSDLYSEEFSYMQIIHPDDRQSFKDDLQDKSMLHRAESFTQEYRIINKEGCTRWFDDRKWIRRDHHGNITHYHGIIMDITERKQLEVELSYLLDMRRLFNSISASFINLPPEDIQKGIDDTLKTLGGFVNEDRCYAFQISPDGRYINETNEWCAPDIEQRMDRLTNTPIDLSPWLRKQLENFEIVQIHKISELPAEAKRLKNFLHSQNIQSMVAVPMIYGNTLIGFIGFEAVRREKIWDKNHIMLLSSVAEIIANACARKRTEEELSIYQSQLLGLSSELLLTEERERRRIATGLHDRIGHALTTSSIKLGQLRQEINNAGLSKKIDEIYNLIDQTIQDTQTLTFELSPPILYDLGLEPAVDWLVEQTENQHGLRIELHDDMRPKPLDNSHRVMLFQAIRELLFNIVKHAGADKAVVSLERKNSSIRIRIEDNGVGFDTTGTYSYMKKKGGFGLFSVRERLIHQGGDFNLYSKSGKGTRITIEFPLD